MRSILGAVTVLALVTFVGCGGSTADVVVSGDGGDDGGAADGSSGDASRDAGGDVAHVDGGAPIHHRPNDSQCQTTPPAGNCTPMSGPAACMTDATCTAGANGRCVENAFGARLCHCSYDTCMHDTDCPSGQLCVCHASAYTTGGNTCIAGSCRIDTDCASGYCSPSHGNTGCGGVTGYYCHTASDTCENDSDCPSMGGPQVCAWSATHSRWECQAQLLCP
jgi:hypothetical protein